MSLALSSNLLWASDAGPEVPQYYPALFRRADGFAHIEEIDIFPPRSPKVTTRLTTFPLGFRFLTFGPDASSIYFQATPTYGRPRDTNEQDYIAKWDLASLRSERVPGSEGIGQIRYLTVGSNIFVSGTLESNARGVCGAYRLSRIGPADILRQGQWPDCGGGAGPVSADGRYLISFSGTEWALLDLRSGAIAPLGSGLQWPAWSPDGRQLAVTGPGGTYVIDALTPKRRRRVAGSSVGPAIWSPDSKYLLVPHSQFSCAMMLYGGRTLAIVDVARRKTMNIPATHCTVTSESYGWVRAEALAEKP